jgi:hypothetical protein
MTDKLLTSKEIITTVRDLSANLATDRIDNYISESQTVEIRDFLGATLYAALQNDYDDLLLTFGEARFTELWYGIEYDGVIFNGLQNALNYWAYSRFINQQQTEVTRWGVQSLTGEESEDISNAQVRIKGRDAEQMALRYQNDAAKFLKARASIYPEYKNNCDTSGKKTSFNFFKV